MLAVILIFKLQVSTNKMFVTLKANVGVSSELTLQTTALPDNSGYRFFGILNPPYNIDVSLSSSSISFIV